jgi:hypothetical protein
LLLRVVGVVGNPAAAVARADLELVQGFLLPLAPTTPLPLEAVVLQRLTLQQKAEVATIPYSALSLQMVVVVAALTIQIREMLLREVPAGAVAAPVMAQREILRQHRQAKVVLEAMEHLMRLLKIDTAVVVVVLQRQVGLQVSLVAPAAAGVLARLRLFLAHPLPMRAVVAGMASRVRRVREVQVAVVRALQVQRLLEFLEPRIQEAAEVAVILALRRLAPAAPASSSSSTPYPYSLS